MTIKYIVGKRYARALWESLDDKNLAAALVKEIKAFSQTLEQSALSAAMLAPSLTLDEKLSLLESVAAKQGLGTLAQRFLRQCLRAGRIEALPQVIEAFERLYHDHNSSGVAYVKSAFALSVEQDKVLNEALNVALAKELTLHVEVDPSLIVGLRVEVNGRIIDATLLENLNEMEKELLNKGALA